MILWLKKQVISALIVIFVIETAIFLIKHNINLKDFTYGTDLRYNCFLCNKCQSVCLKDLSGKEIFMEMRKEDIRGALDEKKIIDPYIYKDDGFSKS